MLRRFNFLRVHADSSGMRARGVGSLVGLLVTGAMSVATMHALGSSGKQTPSDPLKVARNGVTGICANQRAVDDAGSGDEYRTALTLPANLAKQLRGLDPSASAVINGAASCASQTPTP